MDLLDRKKAIPILIGDHKRFLIISGLAGPAKDIGFLTKESPNTFLFGGAMGGALSTSLGLALSRPNDRVLCVSGDGDILMSMGCLATIATIKPKNLIIICVDNGLYLETNDGVKLVPVKATDSIESIKNSDLIIYTVKTYHNDDVAKQISKYINPYAKVLCLQNGITSWKDLENIIGKNTIEALLSGFYWGYIFRTCGFYRTC